MTNAQTPPSAPSSPPATTTPPPKPAARTGKVRSEGSFTDKAGNRHVWQINSAHTLLWDGNPYLPVGSAFASRSLQSESDATWQEDVRALTALKAKGVQDILIWPMQSLPDLKPAALQRLIDYLDANQFRYGLSFGPGLTTPLRGLVAHPTRYRFDERSSLTATWRVTNTDAGRYFLIDAASDFRLFRTGNASLTDNIASVPIEAPQTVVRPIAYLLPHTTLPVTGDGTLPDLWTAFDGYRDRVLGLLTQIKFGPGFRFFLDPITRHLGFSGETDYLVPESNAFRLEWESYLTRNYGSLDDLKQAWMLMDDLKTAADFARLVPLWANRRGLPYFYDPQTQKTYRIQDQTTTQSKWWDDFLRCRNESAFYSMNAMADLLKTQIANVPIVYTWTQTHPLFTNSDRNGGFDGLSIAVNAEEPSRLARVLGPAWSQAEQADRSIWFLATELIETPSAAASRPQAQVTTAGLPPDGRTPSPSQASASGSDFARCLTDLHQIGAKGVFLRASGEGNSDETLPNAGTLDHLRELAAPIAAASAQNYVPNVMFYPQATPGPAHTGMVPGAKDVFWLSSFYKGQGIDWWPAYSGYTVQHGADQASEETVLVSLQGERKTRLLVPDVNKVSARAPDGTPVPFKPVGKSALDITLSSTPTIFRADGQQLIPQQAAEDALLQLQNLYDEGVVAKVPSIESARAALGKSMEYLRQRDFNNAFVFARSELDVLTQDVKPYIWIEGEAPAPTVAHNFNEVAPNPEASGGGFLRLSTSNPPGRLPYAARYTFDVPRTGRYNIWVAGTPPGPTVSPITWYVNTEPEQSPVNPRPQGPLWLSDRFGWYLLGTVSLEQGTRYLTFKVNGPNNAGDYVFSIDAILITQRGFAPNATVRPLPVEGVLQRPSLGRPSSKEKRSERLF